MVVRGIIQGPDLKIVSNVGIKRFFVPSLVETGQSVENFRNTQFRDNHPQVQFMYVPLQKDVGI